MRYRWSKNTSKIIQNTGAREENPQERKYYFCVFIFQISGVFVHGIYFTATSSIDKPNTSPTSDFTFEVIFL